jgi:hypothetical protein
VFDRWFEKRQRRYWQRADEVRFHWRLTRVEPNRFSPPIEIIDKIARRVLPRWAWLYLVFEAVRT